MDPKKLQGVTDWQHPKDATGIHRFLGFTGFYCHFVARYSDLVQPLLDLTKKAVIWHWSDSQECASQKLKQQMTEGPILWQPNFSKWFFVQTNTSANGVGAILAQEGEIPADLEKSTMLRLHPVAYYSATFMPTQK